MHEPSPSPMLSPIQRAYLVGNQEGLELRGPARYHVACDLRSDRVGELCRNLRQLVREHAVLRTEVTADLSVVVRPEEFAREIDVDVRKVDDAGFDAANAAVRAAFTSDSFMFPGPSRFQIMAVHAPGRARLHLVYDLWLMDAASLDAFLAELVAGPGAFTGPSLDSPPATGRDRSERDRRFWRGRAAALAGPAELPLRPDWRRSGLSAAHRLVELDAATGERFAKAALDHGLTPAMAHLAVYGACLGRAGGGGPHTLTVLHSRRGQDPGRDGFGNHGNTMPLEIPASARQSILEIARGVQSRYLAQAMHGSLSGGEIVRFGEHGGDPRRLPYPFAFTALETDRRAERSLGFVRRWDEVQLRVPQVLIDHQVFSDADGTVRLGFDWRSDAFDTGFVDDLVDQYADLVQRLAAEPGAWTEPPRRAVGDVRPPVPGAAAHDTLHGRVLTTAAARPGEPAVHDEDGTLSYRALLARAGALADALTAAGARPGDRVAVHLPRGRGQVIAVLGALLAGCVYIPLDHATPDGRLDGIARRGEVRFAVTTDDEPTQERWARRGVRALTASAAPDPHGGEDVVRPAEVAPDGTAYIIFTSGSTGEPKGVVISHTAALTTIDAVNDLLGLDGPDRVLSVSSLGFDLSVYDMFGPLLRGGSVVMLSERTARDPGAWTRLIDRHRVTVWNSAPALASLLVAEGSATPSLRAFMLSGDWIPLSLPDELRRLSATAEIISLGGATEGAIWSISHRVTADDRDGRSIPYGTALPGQRILVLDAERRVCPDWHIGEIHICGAGVANGYAGAPERTRAAFFDDPEYGRTYRTGDRGRRHPGGVVEFLGRTDSQVKVNGHRVEPGEIEHVLESVTGVARCAVCVRGDGARRRIVAHVRLDADAPADWRDSADRAAAQALPRYMVPDLVVELPEIPLTGNGKVDRKRLRSLPLPAESAPARPAPAARGLREQEVARCWQEVLGRAAGTGSFFDEGGSSFEAIRLLSRLRSTYGYDLAFGDFMADPTVGGLAARCGADEARARGAVWAYSPRPAPQPRSRLVLFPPVGGGVSCYAELTKGLAPDIEVHVVGIDAPAPEEGGLEELARLCLAALPAVPDSPVVPVVFAGWSFGGALAYEAAGLATVPVARAVVVDTPVSAASRRADAPADADAFLRDIRRAGGMAVTAEQLSAEPALRDRFEVYRHNSRLLRGWEPRSVSVPVVELRADTESAEQQADAWRRTASVERTESLAGDHYDVFEEDNMQRIRRAIEEVRRAELG